jgi:hypothetical protein
MFRNCIRHREARDVPSPAKSAYRHVGFAQFPHFTNSVLHDLANRMSENRSSRRKSVCQPPQK